MIECADCGYGFEPENLRQSLCSDCIENRLYWLEMEEEQSLKNAIAVDTIHPRAKSDEVSL